MFFERITVFCFAASYAVAFALELAQLFRPRPMLRLIGIGFGSAGLLAQTLFLAVHRPTLASRDGSLLFLSWILSVFYLYGTLHHRKIAWGLFVLPLVLGLIGLAVLFAPERSATEEAWLPPFWVVVHLILLLLAAVGICVGFIASVMYLVHARRLRSKTLPGQGLKFLSLERLEEMNRRAIILAFPLLTAGVLVGMALLARSHEPVQSWTDPRVLLAGALWLVFGVLLYLRYSLHVRGRRVAILTIIAFLLMLMTLAVPHTLGGGGAP
jgi:ABC-type transport system involved in cytochrome c biogenesis permease subunit